MISCNTISDKKDLGIKTVEVKNVNEEEIIQIEKNGKSFYDWYFKNDFPNCDIISDKNGKCTFDTTGYFNDLRKLGTISEKFIEREKERLQTCQDFISTIDFAAYEKAEAYDYADYCVEIYYMYWIKSQEPPNSFSAKNVRKINDNKASLDIYESYGTLEEPLSAITLEKENTIWKITEIKFINRDDPTPKKKEIYGKWKNAMVTLNIGKEGLAFEYHTQCVYFYPIKKINDDEFEMIWSEDMDCKFDNGTSETFNLKDFPTIGKPFAKFKLKNNILYAEYYYKDWVKQYTEKVATDVFTSKYFMKNEKD